MIKIKFNDSESMIEAGFSRNGHVVTIEADHEPNASGFTTYRLNGVQLGDFSEFTTVYRVLENAVQYSDDDSVFIEEEQEEQQEDEPEEAEDMPSYQAQIDALCAAFDELVEMVLGGAE